MENKQIPTSLTQPVPEWKIKLAYFYAEHKVFLKRFSIFLLFFADVIIIFLLGSVFVNYKTGTIKEQDVLNQMRFNLVNTEAISKNKPRSLIIGQVDRIINNTKYDYLAMAENNNSDWAVTELRYTFEVAGKYLEPRQTFILPNSRKQLMYFNSEIGGEATLKILGSRWQKIKDFSLLSYKDGIKVEKSVFKQGQSDSTAGQVEILIFNETPYSFWEVGLPVVIYNRSLKPIGIDYIVINKLLSEEKRKIEIGWHEGLHEFVQQVEIYPEVNLLDNGSIMEIEAGHGSPPGLE
ncbi:hypothetical protein A3B87_01310 [Candidatus Kuenenbacteria bacterium RIFCSPHIGHO2_02_FULL_39_13]|uniref:Uncharacterized protein n=1 Tax=Candidatus Kuenenbacteria bacterium RIFCSPHIGHO2_02_FULL_39_13 TaxID=1798561 RepID=A0A1F6FNC3_9BACT|nr:MAG: hypothetical protein A3B87_01310 [Candidatus Kuenenbacteria bacterium RIFCSPHIGHO2_02_FULL_39_13]